ncbi:Lrp/AsnC family transcriptional regulator [Curvivirga sp.]|uniref:Lrp/AsnC family transcriptional regulator n=1 Tax=Curvivirga sp. TaxID=2856848 RepID=UPI003B5AD5D4
MDDAKLLREIQRDADISLQDLADRVGMSQSTVWRKMQDYEKSGLIKGKVALLDADQLGLKICVVANVSLTSHSEEAVDAFTNLVKDHPEIVECYSLSGAYDYMVKVYVEDIATYESFMSRYLLRNEYIASVTSGFVLKELKNTTELPIRE